MLDKNKTLREINPSAPGLNKQIFFYLISPKFLFFLFYKLGEQKHCGFPISPVLSSFIFPLKLITGFFYLARAGKSSSLIFTLFPLLF